MFLVPTEWLLSTAQTIQKKGGNVVKSAKVYVLKRANDKFLNIPSYIDANPK